MTTKTHGSKDAARTPAPGTADPALTRAKNAARRAIAENIARVEEQERHAAGPEAEPNPQREQGGPMQGPEGSPKAGNAKVAKGAKAKGSNKATPAKKAVKSAKAAPGTKPVKAAKSKKLSCIDAAAQIIGKDPIGCKDLIADMGRRGLWKSPSGKTPEASLYAAIIREIAAKKSAARFKKADRGLFVANAGKGA